jgi:hypothetical protein
VEVAQKKHMQELEAHPVEERVVEAIVEKTNVEETDSGGAAG